MKKRTVSLVMTIMMVTTLSACSEQAKPVESTPAATEVTETADAANPGKAESAATEEEADASETLEYQINNEGYIITVDVNHDAYDTAENSADAPDKLNADMRADNILSDFAPQYGKTELNHPNGIATDGQHFVVCDTWNNRVLIWNSLPTSNVPADVVVGQKNFESFTAGVGMDRLNWPVGVTFAGEKLIIADTHNNRLQVFDSVPTQSGASADHTITAASADEDILWPWAVWSDGKRLITTNTERGFVALWDDLDTAISGEYADQFINTGGSPRTIITDGDYLLIGNHNIGRSQDAKVNGYQGSHVWLTYPENGRDPDFDIDLQLGGTIIDGDLYGSAENDESIHIYDGLIDTADEKSVTTLNTDFEYFRNGDYNPIIYVDGKTYVTYYNSSIVAIYDGKLSEENYMEPIGLLGSDKNVRSASVLRGQYQNPTPASDGTSLAFIDDYNGLIGIYKTIPDTYNAIPDYLYHFPPEWDSPIDIAVGKDGKMLVLTDSSLLIWNRIPVNGEMYDKRIEFEHCIGRERSRVETCEEGFLLYSEADKKLYKLPLSDEAGSFANAINSVDVEWVSGLTCDGTYVCAAQEEDRKVTVFNVSDLSKYGEVYFAGTIQKDVVSAEFEIPKDAIRLPNGQFAVTDNNEIRVWDSLDAAIADRNFTECISMGTLDDYELYATSDGIKRRVFQDMATDGSLFKPTYLAYANGHFWVGEFKFSSRLLRYDIQATEGEETAEETTAETSETSGSAKNDPLLENAFKAHMDYTLPEDAAAVLDTSITGEFTIDCAGHDITLSGVISLSETNNKCVTIKNAKNVDLSGLTFYRDPAQSIGETDILMTISGDDMQISYPADLPKGSRKERTKEFFYEEKDNGSVMIRYGGRE